MAAEGFPGRRLPDALYAEVPEDARPGDYWRYRSRKTGEPVVSAGSPGNGNLTGGVWGIVAPSGAYGTLARHTVREHEDGTVSVRPGDGSSNSILVTGGDGSVWHGYIEHGVWREV